MARLLVGNLDPAKVPAPTSTSYTPVDGAARTMNRWGSALKLGNDFVSSNLGRGLMDLGAAGVGGLVDAAGSLGSTTFGDASQDMPEGDTSGMDAVASAAQAKLGMAPTSPTKSVDPNRRKLRDDERSKLGGEYTKLMEVAERSPDPKVVSATDKRMKLIEGRLGVLNAEDEADTTDFSADNPPDEQTALEMEQRDREIARGKTIDQALGRKRSTDLGNLTPGQAWQRALETYQSMFEDASEREDVKEMYRLSAQIQRARSKVEEHRLAQEGGTPQEGLESDQRLVRLQGLDPQTYGIPAEGVPPTSVWTNKTSPKSVATPPAGKFAPPPAGMTVQSVTNRPGGEEGVYYPDGTKPSDFAPANPPATPKAPTPVATAAESKEDPFDAGLKSLQGKSPSNEDIMGLAAMADTREKRAKVFALAKERPFRPSSLFDFTGGGEQARYHEQLRKTFPKERDMTEYQAASLEEKRLARGEQTRSREERAKLNAEKMAWAKQKWDDYKKMQAGRLKSARGRKGGDPTKPLKDQDKLLKDMEDTANKTLGEFDREEQEADKAARKAREEYELAEAGVVSVPAPKKPSDPDDPKQAEAYEKQLERYREASAKASVAEKRKQLADQAAADAADVKARNKDLKESIKADRDAARKAREGIRGKLGISLPKSEPKPFSPFLSK